MISTNFRNKSAYGVRRKVATTLENTSTMSVAFILCSFNEAYKLYLGVIS